MSDKADMNSLKTNLFVVWFVSLLFGALLLPISLPGFTIFLNLILGVGLFFILFFELGIKKSIQYLKFGLPVFSLFILSGVSMFISEGKSEALYFFRAMLMFGLTTAIFLLSFASFGKTLFTKKFNVGLWYYFGITAVFGAFEYFTGIHLAGNHTDKLLELPVSAITYAPTFLWDNPNTYITYLSIAAISLLVSDKSVQKRKWKQLILILPVFFFSVISDSDIGLMISGIMVLIFLLLHSKSILSSFKPTTIVLASTVLFVIVTVLMNDLYFGPKWKDGEKYRLNGITAVDIDNGVVNILSKDELLSQVNEDTLIKRLHNQVHGGLGSFELRKNLVLNGVEYWKQNPILGVGAGQYSYLNAQGRNKYEVNELLSPHNMAIEVVSQFGVVGVGFLVFLFLGFVRMIRRAQDSGRMIILLGVGVAFVLATCLPSSLLIYDCLWVFVAIITIEAFLIEKPDETKEIS